MTTRQTKVSVGRFAEEEEDNYAGAGIVLVEYEQTDPIVPGVLTVLTTTERLILRVTRRASGRYLYTVRSSLLFVPLTHPGRIANYIHVETRSRAARIAKAISRKTKTACSFSTVVELSTHNIFQSGYAQRPFWYFGVTQGQVANLFKVAKENGRTLGISHRPFLRPFV